MDLNILIVCITVVVCVMFATAAAAYVVERRHKRWESAIALLATCITEFAGGGGEDAE